MADVGERRQFSNASQEGKSKEGNGADYDICYVTLNIER